MRSHHFVGGGRTSASLLAAAAEPQRLLAEIAELVTACQLQVVGRQTVGFANGGLTCVWVLAESHLVLHLWPEEGLATVDLHVCDYRASNARNAAALVERLRSWCFEAGSDRWRELELEASGRTPTAAIR